MTLFFELPSWVTDIMADKYGSEELLYAVPWDLNEQDCFTDGFCVITERNFVFLEGGEVKKEILTEMFRQNHIDISKILGKVEVQTDGNEYYYRNKMEYSLYWDNDSSKIQLAFHARGSHRKIPIQTVSF